MSDMAPCERNYWLTNTLQTARPTRHLPAYVCGATAQPHRDLQEGDVDDLLRVRPHPGQHHRSHLGRPRLPWRTHFPSPVSASPFPLSLPLPRLGFAILITPRLTRFTFPHPTFHRLGDDMDNYLPLADVAGMSTISFMMTSYTLDGKGPYHGWGSREQENRPELMVGLWMAWTRPQGDALIVHRLSFRQRC